MIQDYYKKKGENGNETRTKIKNYFININYNIN